MSAVSPLKQTDGAIFDLIEKETEYQKKTLRLIASENYASKAVMEATGSILTNKYAEGYPKKRYYAGNKYVDEIELLAIDRAKKLFNVGTPAITLLSGKSSLTGSSLPSPSRSRRRRSTP